MLLLLAADCHCLDCCHNRRIAAMGSCPAIARHCCKFPDQGQGNVVRVRRTLWPWPCVTQGRWCNWHIVPNVWVMNVVSARRSLRNALARHWMTSDCLTEQAILQMHCFAALGRQSQLPGNCWAIAAQYAYQLCVCPVAGNSRKHPTKIRKTCVDAISRFPFFTMCCVGQQTSSDQCSGRNSRQSPGIFCHNGFAPTHFLDQQNRK